MKGFFAASILPVAAALADSSSDYVNFIRQVQLDTAPPVEWDVTVPPTGDRLSPTGVSVDGSHFELWSIHNTSAAEYLLDEQYVTSYTPNAVVDILTGDPYLPVRRTRCDQPFQVRVTISGLLDPSDPAYPGAPDAAKKVDYLHSIFAYPDGTHSLEGVSSPVGVLAVEGSMETNTTATVTFNVTNLSGDDLTEIEGEEVFTISALADFGVSASVLDSKRVQIWPIAQGSLSGYDSNVYHEQVPAITVSLTDLYPASSTYLRIYPGQQVNAPVGAVNVSASYVIINDSIPQDRTLVLSDLDRYFVKEGRYTMEILHETPFGVDLISSGGILVDRTVEFTGSIYVGE